MGVAHLRANMAQVHLAVLIPFFLLVAGVASVPLTGNTRIHGGSDAVQGEFPYIISIRRIANAFKHMCAGVLIHPDWVLTSAFCVSEVGTYSIDAVGGEHNLIVPSAHEQIRGVENIIRHPNYTHSDASVDGMATPESNDLALIKLKSPMEENEYVKVINLASETPASGECVTAGWGTKSITGLLMTAVLQKAPASLVDMEECKEIMNPAPTVQIFLRKKHSALVEQNLLLALATCGEMLGVLWSVLISLQGLLVGVLDVVREAIHGSTQRWLTTKNGY